MGLIEEVERIAAERKAAQDAEEKQRQDLIADLNRQAQDRLDNKRRDEQAKADAMNQARQERGETDLNKRARHKFFTNPAATDEDFQRLYPQLRDELILEDARIAEKRRHSVYSTF